MTTTHTAAAINQEFKRGICADDYIADLYAQALADTRNELDALREANTALAERVDSLVPLATKAADYVVAAHKKWLADFGDDASRRMYYAMLTADAIALLRLCGEHAAADKATLPESAT